MRIGTFVSGLFFVLIGTAFLLINFGYGSWNSVMQIGKWWPILLIFLGLSLFNFGRIPRWIAFIVLLLAVMAVSCYMVMVSPTRDYSAQRTASTLTVGRQEYPLIKQANLSVDYGGGQLLLSPGSPDIFRGEFNSDQIKKNIATNDQTLKIDLSQTGNQWSAGQFSTANRWQMQISPELIWNLNINAGAVNGVIDLSGVPLKQLNCNLGAGSVDFILNNNGPNGRLKITAGASNIKLNISGDTGVSITMGGALNTDNLDELGWIKTGNRYQSPNYNQAANKIDCDIQLSAGNLEVKTGLDI